MTGRVINTQHPLQKYDLRSFLKNDFCAREQLQTTVLQLTKTKFLFLNIVLHHLCKRNLYIKSLLVRIFKSSYRRSVVQIYLLSLYLLRHSFFFHLSSSPTSSSFSSSRFLLARIPPPSRPHPHPPDMARGRVTPTRASRRPSSTYDSGRILSCLHRSPSALPSVALNRRRHLQLPLCRRHGFPLPGLAPTTVALRHWLPPPASFAGSAYRCRHSLYGRRCVVAPPKPRP
jgi:hypothetical protein